MKEQKKRVKKSSEQKQQKWLKSYVVLALVLVLVTSVICATFAWYVDNVTRKATVSFAEINISDDASENVFAENTIIENVVPNMKIADKVIFSKAETSRPFFVRLRMRYALDTDIDAVGVIPWIAGINATPLTNLEHDDYGWSSIQEDGYYYLINYSDPTMMYKVETTNTIYFVKELTFPAGNLQLLNEDGDPIQKGLDLSLTIIIEAIQADIPEVNDGSVEATLTNIAGYFSSSEKELTFVDYIEATGEQYINTDLETCSGLRSEVKFMTSSKSQWLYGGRKNDSKSGYGILFTSTDRGYNIQTASGSLAATSTYDINGKITTLVHDATGVKFVEENGTEHSLASYAASDSYTTKTDIYLCYVNGNASGNMFRGRLYSAKFYVGDVLVLNLKPAIVKATGKAILYDVVSGKYYYNDGDGNDFLVP